MMFLRSPLAAAAVVAVTMFSSSVEAGSGSHKNSVASMVFKRDDTSTLFSVLEAAKLVDTLGGEGPFTLFAPTNEAFSKVPPGILDFLSKPENKEALQSLLLYHVVAGAAVKSDAILSGAVTKAEMAQGEKVTIAVKNGGVVLNDEVNVLEVDIKASNGVIHTIDQVLLPPSLVQTVIDNLLNVEEIIKQDDDLSSLEQAIKDANLKGALANPDVEFTVFAPSNKAFKNLGAALEKAGVTLTKELLATVLTYHVVAAGAFPASSASNGDTLPTLQGGELTFKVSNDGEITIKAVGSTAKVVKTDLFGSNGVVHIIDTVLLPVKI